MSDKNIMQGNNKIFRHHLRRSSLDTLIKMKNNSFHQQSQNFRKSCTSFGKIKPTKNQQFPLIKNDIKTDNIYFNPHSRANFFKNLIDSYFTKSQQNMYKQKDQGDKNSLKSSYMLRKSLANRRKQNDENTLNQNKNRYTKIQSKDKKQNQQLYHQLLNCQKKQNDKEKKRISLRYKQQNKSPRLVSKDETVIISTQNLTNQQRKNVIQNKNESSFLPKITQAVDDFEQEHQTQQNIGFIQTTETFMRGSTSFSLFDKKGSKSLIYQNSVLNIYLATQMNRKNKIKQFKNYIFIERYNKAVSKGVKPIWKQYRFDQLSLITDSLQSLKANLYQIYPNPVYSDQLIIQPKPLYFKLMANQCQQLFLMFGQLISNLSRLQKNIINNSITPQNLYLMKDGKLQIGDWQFSAFRDQNQIQGGLFESRTQPILKCENQWLVQPQYLAPQILSSIINVNEQFDLWKRDNISDIFSIGLTFLQIITLIPLNMDKYTSIKTKPTLRPRQGFLSISNKSLPKIIESQKNIIKKVTSAIQKQVDKNQKNDKFFSLLLKMIEPNRQKRISFNEILKQIK